MNNIFASAKRTGEPVYFVAQSWSEARQRATELAGKRYRFIALCAPGTTSERKGRAILGI